MDRAPGPFEYDSESTTDLISAARRGSRDAQNQLFGQLQAYLKWVADRKLDPSLRQKFGPSDAVQQSMLRATENFGEFRGSTPEQLHAWVREILVNEVRQIRRTYFARKRDIARERNWVNVSDSRRHNVDPADSLPTPGAQAIDQEQSAALNRALHRLPDDYRQVIQLRNWDRLSFGEIAQRLDRSENAVTKLWFRALLRLEKEMKTEHG